MNSPTNVQCSECGSVIGETVDRCETCGNDVGAPNVRLAAKTAEKSALEARYQQAIEDAVSRGAAAQIESFTEAVKKSVVVINMSITSLQDLISRDTSLYWNYHKGVRASTRKAATLVHDRERLGIDATLFGQIGDDLTAAALSLRCRGLTSYGAFCIQLREVAIARRSSLIEENSFFFVKRHSVLAGHAGPLGYLSGWQDRYKLAVAKLAPRIEASTSESDFQSLVLVSDGNRASDQFIEVQIYGVFDNKAIERVSGPKPKSGFDIAIWEVIKESAMTAGQIIEEYP